MRIAYVCADPGVPVFGRKGCSVHVQEVVRAFCRTGADVELFAARVGGEPPPNLGAVRVHSLPNPGLNDAAVRERAGLEANGGLYALLEAAGPFDLVYERYSLWSFAGMSFARNLGIPGLLEVNTPLIEEQAAYRGLLNRSAAERVAERVYRTSTALIAVSREVADYLERFPAAHGRIHVISNGVDPDRFPPDQPASLPGPEGSFTVGFVGTLKPWHGLPVLVAAFEQLHRDEPNTRLLVVGDGPERARLEGDLAARGLIEPTVLTGSVEPWEVPGLLASMDAAVAPYPNRPDFYFSPLKLYEYLAAGRAVVASRIGQVTELIEAEVNGLLVSPGDVEALAKALARLKADPALRTRLGRAGRDMVRERHTWDSVVQRLLALGGICAEVEV